MAISFDGTDDAILCGTGEDVLTTTSVYSVYAVVTPTSDTASGGVQPRIYERVGGVGGGGSGLLLATPAAVDFIADVGALNDLEVQSANNSLTLNTRNVIVVTWDGGAAIASAHIYINGVEPSYGFTTSSSGAILGNSGATFVIGNRTDLTRSFPGTIHELAVFSTVLGAASISLLASFRRNQPFNVTEGKLKRYYKFDEQTAGSADAVVVTDVAGSISGTGTDGTNNTGCAFVVEGALHYPQQMAAGGFWGGA